MARRWTLTLPLMVACSSTPPVSVPTARNGVALDLEALSDAQGLPHLELRPDEQRWRGNVVDNAADAAAADETAGDTLVLSIDAGIPWGDVRTVLGAMGARYQRAALVVAGDPAAEPVAPSGETQAQVRMSLDQFVFRPAPTLPLFVGTDVRMMGALAETGGGVLAAGPARATGDVVHTLDLLHGAAGPCWWAANDPLDTVVSESAGTPASPRTALFIPLAATVGSCAVSLSPPEGTPPVPPPGASMVIDLSGSLSAAQLDAALPREALEACADPLAARIDIGSDGRIVGAGITALTVPERRDGAEQCIARVLQSVTFPGADAPTRAVIVAGTPPE